MPHYDEWGQPAFDPESQLSMLRPSAPVVPGESPEEIEKRMSFTVTPGEYLATIAGLSKRATAKNLEETNFLVNVDNQPRNFQSRKIVFDIRLVFPHPSGRDTVEDTFQWFPQLPSQMLAYTQGVFEGKTNKGTHSAKLLYFIGALGFRVVPGQPLPPAAMDVALWKGIGFHCKVKLSEPWENKATGAKTTGGFPQIVMFSYKKASEHECAEHGLKFVRDDVIIDPRAASPSPAGPPVGGAVPPAPAPPPPARPRTRIDPASI